MPSHQKRPPGWGGVGDLREAVFNSTKVFGSLYSKGEASSLAKLESIRGKDFNFYVVL